MSCLAIIAVGESFRRLRQSNLASIAEIPDPFAPLRQNPVSEEIIRPIAELLVTDVPVLHRATSGSEGQWCETRSYSNREQAELFRRERRHHGARELYVYPRRRVRGFVSVNPFPLAKRP
jgi:hypothetical protein